jgi:hypothetical protein
MLALRRLDVPEYLRSGQFFTSLNEGDEEEFEVPQDSTEADDDIYTFDDAFHVIRSLRFWMVNKVPDSLLIFILSFMPLGKMEWFDKVVTELEGILDCSTWQKSHRPECKLHIAISMGRTEVVKWLLSNRVACVLTEKHTQSTATYGHPELLTFLYAKVGKLSPGAARGAAMGGHLDCLQFAIEHGNALEPDLATSAARAGSIQCLEYLFTVGCPVEPTAIDAAAASGHFDVARYLHGRGMQLTSAAVVEGAKRNNFSFVKYAYEHGGPWDARVVRITAAAGMADILRFALTNGCPHALFADCGAVEGGHVECLKVLAAFNYSWSALALKKAIFNSHLFCAMFLYKQFKISGHADTAFRKIDSDANFVDILLANGCRRTDDFCVAAAEYGQLECLVYAHGVLSLPLSTRAYEHAVTAGELSCIDYLRKQGYYT